MGVSAAALRDSTQVELQGQLKVNELEIASRKRAIAGLQGRINLYQERLNQSPIREQQLADLTRGYEQSKNNYDSLLAKKNSSELATNLEVEQKSEHFRILDPPSLPVKPSSPNRLKLCAIGLFFGLLVGISFVIGSEFLDDRIFEEEALQRLLPTTILTDIPKIATEDELRRARAADRFQWFATAIVFCFVLAGSALTILRG